MKLTVTVTLVAFFLTTSLLFSQERSGDGKAIETLLDSYERAVRDADTTLMLSLWSNDESVSYVSPSSRIQSAEGLKGFLGFFRTNFTARELKRKNVAIHLSGDFAWATFDWDFTATKTDGTLFTASGWETQLYHKDVQGWRIIHVHYSVPK